jgi:DNA-binding Lrp family transcriptional regulator
VYPETIESREVAMVNAIVLLKVDRNRINGVAQELVAIDGVSEVYSVAGQWDLVAVLRAKDDDQFADIVTEGMLKVEGIRSSETLIAFRVLSRYDLERMFSIGME